jgi:hypothetical protein
MARVAGQQMCRQSPGGQSGMKVRLEQMSGSYKPQLYSRHPDLAMGLPAVAAGLGWTMTEVPEELPNPKRRDCPPALRGSTETFLATLTLNMDVRST